ncbi:MAG TPA: hypothetical protein VMU14_08585 [Acidimicrobiales bacterium]|nr:hypothetical protein [Acidimicrobiales bacterium]
MVTAQKVDDAHGTATAVHGPVVIDLTDSRPPVVDEEYVVEWQLSDAAARAAEDRRAVVSRA